MRDIQFRTIFYFAHKHGYFRRSPAQQYNYMIKKLSKTEEEAYKIFKKERELNSLSFLFYA